MTGSLISRIAGVVLLGATLPAAGCAQTAAPPAPKLAQTARPPVPGLAPTAAPGAAEGTLSKSMSASIEAHIRTLHDQLQITPAQQPQWEQFAQVMRDNAAKMNRIVSRRGARANGMNAQESMQSYAELTQVHATNMQKLASAFQSLYAAFPEQQKQVADTLFRGSNGRLPHHRHDNDADKASRGPRP